MVVFIKGMECYKVDYNDNLERIDARSSRSDRAMALVGAVDAVPPHHAAPGRGARARAAARRAHAAAIAAAAPILALRLYWPGGAKTNLSKNMALRRS